MFSKNSTDESKVSAFNAAMTTIRENNVYDTIMARYQQ
jgi:ABC-type amino acid transport substrate-binding protein